MLTLSWQRPFCTLVETVHSLAKYSAAASGSASCKEPKQEVVAWQE